MRVVTGLSVVNNPSRPNTLANNGSFVQYTMREINAQIHNKMVMIRTRINIVKLIPRTFLRGEIALCDDFARVDATREGENLSFLNLE